MVAACAFLIILVILFGVEAVRSFFFGTLGIVGWIVAIVLGLGAICMFGEWLAKERKEGKEKATKRTEKERKEDKKNTIIAFSVLGFMLAALAVGLIVFFATK